MKPSLADADLEVGKNLHVEKLEGCTDMFDERMFGAKESVKVQFQNVTDFGFPVNKAPEISDHHERAADLRMNITRL